MIKVMFMFLNFVVYIVKHIKNFKYNFMITFFFEIIAIFFIVNIVFVDVYLYLIELFCFEKNLMRNFDVIFVF